MLKDSLLAYEQAYNKIIKDLSDEDFKREFVDHADIPKATALLENLIKSRVAHLQAFELMLKINKDRALYILQHWYLLNDLTDHEKDQVADLDVILCDVKTILGAEELNTLLNCNEFLAKNKKNERVKQAIKFALEE